MNPVSCLGGQFARQGHCCGALIVGAAHLPVAMQPRRYQACQADIRRRETACRSSRPCNRLFTQGCSCRRDLPFLWQMGPDMAVQCVVAQPPLVIP